MNISEINLKNLILDLIFYPFGCFLFFNHYLPVVLSLITILVLVKLKLGYQKDLYNSQFNDFVDFLNFLSAHISVGQSVKYAILNVSPNALVAPSLRHTLIKLQKNLILNAAPSELGKTIAVSYPIGEALTFSEHLQLAINSNSQAVFIVNKTLDMLYLKKKTYQEIEMILFQKKLEQMILTVAPLFIIAFIRSTSTEYLTVLYATLPGQIIMGISFGLLIAMKLISDRLVVIHMEV